MSIVFDEKKHSYLLDGVQVPSTTQILEAVGITTNQDCVKNIEVYQQIGTEIHKNIECYIKGFVPTIDLPQNLLDEIDLLKKKKFALLPELIVFSKKNGYCGRADLIAQNKDGFFVFDWKSAKTIDSLAINSQLSMYAKAYEEMNGIKCLGIFAFYNLRGAIEKYEEAEKKECDIIDIQPILEAYRNGKKYTAIVKYKIDDFALMEIEDELTKFAVAKKEFEKIEQAKKEAETRLKDLMKEAGITKFETNNFKFSLSNDTTKKSVDVEKLKADGIFDKYCKETAVVGSLRITKK